MKKLFIAAGLIIGLAGLVASDAQTALAQEARNQQKNRDLRIVRSMPKEAVACLECHRRDI